MTKKKDSYTKRLDDEKCAGYPESWLLNEEEKKALVEDATASLKEIREFLKIKKNKPQG